MISLWLAAAAGEHARGFADPHNRVLVGSTLVVVLVLVGLAYLSRKAVIPTGFGAVLEHIYDWIDGLACGMMGREGSRYVPLAMSLFLFVLASNWSGLVPVPTLTSKGGELTPYEAPSVSYNTTLALALISFLAFNYYGIRKHLEPRPVHPGEGEPARRGGLEGLGTWIAHFWQPTPTLWRSLQGALKWLLVPCLAVLFVFLNVVEELARVVSLSVRLYGNIFGEHTVKAKLLETLGGFVSQMGDGGLGAFLGLGLMALLLWASSLFVLCIGTLAGFIQAFIFFILTLSYIAHAVTTEH